MDNYYYELARTTLNGELDNFDHSPKEYLRSLGWQVDKYPKIAELKGFIAPTKEDYSELAGIMESTAEGYKGEDDISQYVLESNAVSDFLSNYVAGQILKTYPKNIKNKSL